MRATERKRDRWGLNPITQLGGRLEKSERNRLWEEEKEDV